MRFAQFHLLRLDLAAGTIKTAAALMVVMLSLTACASAPRPESEWVKSRESAEDFKSADQECQQRAFAATAGQYIQSTATKAALGVYLTCMKDKGWTQVQRGQPTPTNNP